ncbi:MAG: GntR family transcriptional regulator [Planctomycetota bacterium]
MSSKSTRHDEIVAAIRASIVAGEYAPGERLPPRTAVEAEFGASSATVQKAFDTLAREGFVHSARGSGTVVAEHPPNACRFAVVFDKEPGAPGWTQYYAAFLQAAQAQDQAGGRRFVPYYGVVANPPSPAYEALLEDAGAHRLAGVIAHSLQRLQNDSPLLDDDAPPVVMVTASAPRPGMTVLALDNRRWAEIAVARLAHLGCRRLGVIYVESLQTLSHLQDAASAAQMTIPAEWVYRACPCPRGQDGVRDVVRLLLSRPAPDRPDGLILTDDHFVEAASGGIIEAGLRTPDDLRVVAHANFPHVTATALAIERFGFDLEVVLQEGVRAIEARRRGEAHPETVRVRPIFGWSEVHETEGAGSFAVP